MIARKDWEKGKTLEHFPCSARRGDEVRSCRTFHKLLVTYSLENVHFKLFLIGMWNLPSIACAKPRQPERPRHPDAIPTPVLGVDRQTQSVCLFVYQICATTTASKKRLPKSVEYLQPADLN